MINEKQSSVLQNTSDILTKHYPKGVPGRNKRLVKINTNFKIERGDSLNNSVKNAYLPSMPSQSSSLIDRIQKKLAINREHMKENFIPYI